MESTKHSLQDQYQFLLPSSSTLVEESSSYAATDVTTTGLSSHFCWTPNNNNLNSGTLGSYANASGALMNSRNSRLQQNDILVPSSDASMTSQDLNFDWFNNNPSSHDLHHSQIKQELSGSYSKFSDMISSSQSSSIMEEEGDINDINVKLLLRTLSPGGGQSSNCTIPEDFYYSSSSPQMRTGSFSQIYPTVNVSSFRQLGNSSSRNFDMNLQALDLLNSSRFGGSLSQSFQDQLGLISGNGFSNYGLDNYMKQPIQRPLNSSNIMTSFSSSRVAELKRSDVVLEPKASQAVAKRSRMESRSSCPPFKVRKEKLGDRISALQQLVAPFGKTDTASVLMEAIGYIKFLQSQVETLSVPYLKSSCNKSQRAAHKQGGSAENGSHEERKRDLKSRGLCLVPLSCLSYMTDSGGAVWPPPNFGGGT